jgi:hypothetical protein
MQIALNAVVLALPVRLTLSVFELIELIAVRRLASAHQREATAPGTSEAQSAQG